MNKLPANVGVIKKQPFLVEINLGKSIIASVKTSAVNEEKAKENVFMILRFKVKKDYSNAKPKR